MKRRGGEEIKKQMGAERLERKKERKLMITKTYKGGHILHSSPLLQKSETSLFPYYCRNALQKKQKKKRQRQKRRPVFPFFFSLLCFLLFVLALFPYIHSLFKVLPSLCLWFFRKKGKFVLALSLPHFHSHFRYTLQGFSFLSAALCIK